MYVHLSRRLAMSCLMNGLGQPGQLGEGALSLAAAHILSVTEIESGDIFVFTSCGEFFPPFRPPIASVPLRPSRRR